MGVFKAVLNSGMLRDIPNEDIHPGASIYVCAGQYKFIYIFIYIQEIPCGFQRGILFIDNCDYLAAPVVPDRDDVSTVTPDFGFCGLDMNMVEVVDRDSVFLFSDCHQHEDGFLLYNNEF